jgi:hypothetical protein
VIAHLADLVPDERQARASAGLGLLLEHAAHLIMRRAAPRTTCPSCSTAQTSAPD